ncbi:hypothetical protein C1929_07610 [Stenotrophomonas sp. ZAC14D1_NAIMI4_6]|uniref:hypothetical protein n=1 Tax=unclassified Stenotrophomonas maltophilia group TaxID=2961925 RepID=UPI000D53E5B5|nr:MULTISPECIES: hypothetical protein [unclassified Stenotrophomonas maltophilia group]AWH36626.1 hypothetical protein C1929_07610 [Stenotrophomonas sp. ZAC14D1_NAIMI4_6]AWH40816.1 hypothetical protein C1927_07935 [Stenotrophomonas sp. ZAC14D1_NAIMI4_1]
MDHLAAIDLGLSGRVAHDKIARKVFLTYPTQAFVGNEELQYEILNEVAEQWAVPITSIHVCGSAKLGVSIHKARAFVAGQSDLDLAIIDERLFIGYMEAVLNLTKGYTDGSRFPLVKGVSYKEQYLAYVAKGMLRPDLMPVSEMRAEWTNFFGRLSAKHNREFKSISAMIYLSERFFESKQRSVIRGRVGMGVVK